VRAFSEAFAGSADELNGLRAKQAPTIRFIEIQPFAIQLDKHKAGARWRAIELEVAALDRASDALELGFEARLIFDCPVLLVARAAASCKAVEHAL
jgi:hypothetical protein